MSCCRRGARRSIGMNASSLASFVLAGCPLPIPSPRPRSARSAASSSSARRECSSGERGFCASRRPTPPPSSRSSALAFFFSLRAGPPSVSRSRARLAGSGGVGASRRLLWVGKEKHSAPVAADGRLASAARCESGDGHAQSSMARLPLSGSRGPVFSVCRRWTSGAVECLAGAAGGEEE